MSSNLLEGLVNVVERTFHGLFGIDARVASFKRNETRARSIFDISGIIGITGKRRGAVVVSFPIDLANVMTARMTGKEVGGDLPEESVIDCVGETASIVADNFLPLLGKAPGNAHRISLPSVVVGGHCVVRMRKDLPFDTMLFKSGRWTFGAGISLHEEKRERMSDCSNLGGLPGKERDYGEFSRRYH